MNTYKNLFVPHLAFPQLLFLEFGQREVIFLFTKSKQTLTWQKEVRKRVKHHESCKPHQIPFLFYPRVSQILRSCTSPSIRPYITYFVWVLHVLFPVPLALNVIISVQKI